MAREQGGRRYGGRTAEERREARRTALLDAAYDLYGTLGHRNVTIERLCSEAHLTARNFYEEFGSREALLRAVYDRTVDRAYERIDAALAVAGPDVRSKSQAGIGTFVHAMLDDPRAARIVCLEVVGVSDELEAHRRSVVRAFAEAVADEARQLAGPGGVVLRRDPRITTLALVGGVYELIVDWLQSADRLPLEDVVAEVVDLFVAAGEGPSDWPTEGGTARM